jgi:small subunit ribosomal protein S20
MAHSLSAKKRIRQNEKARARNRWRRVKIKDATKEFLEAVQTGDSAKAAESYKAATKTLDQIAAKGTIHKNTASRRKSRLAARLKAMKAAAAGA